MVISGARVKIKWTRHAEERQREWEKKLGITRQEVEDVVMNPEQIAPGDRDALVAQKKRGRGLLRVLFIETERELSTLTVYWTSKVGKYWRES